MCLVRSAATIPRTVRALRRIAVTVVCVAKNLTTKYDVKVTTVRYQNGRRNQMPQ